MKIDIRRHSYQEDSTDFPQPCDYCCAENEKPLYVIDMDGKKATICEDCMEDIYNEIGHVMRKTVDLNSSVWELIRYNDGEWHIFPMIVKTIRPYGAIKWKNGEPTIWNIYAESPDHNTCMYTNFYEMGKSWFFSEKEAKRALKERQREEKDGKR